MNEVSKQLEYEQFQSALGLSKFLGSFLCVRRVQCKENPRVPISLSARVDSEVNGSLQSLVLLLPPKIKFSMFKLDFMACLGWWKSTKNLLKILKVSKRYLWTSNYDLKFLFVWSHDFYLDLVIFPCRENKPVQEPATSLLHKGTWEFGCCARVWICSSNSHLKMCYMISTHKLCDRHTVLFLFPINSAFLAEISYKIKFSLFLQNVTWYISLYSRKHYHTVNNWRNHKLRLTI